MADGRKVCVDSGKTIPDLHNNLKSAIGEIIQQKDWSGEQKDEVRRTFLKIYEETVELSMRENVMSLVREEMEPVNKKRVLEVNTMCAKSEGLLTSVIKKRKSYPQRIKECLRKQYESDLDQLRELDKNPPENVDSTMCDKTPINVEEYEEYFEKLRVASDSLVVLNKTMPEVKEKAKRLHLATETDLRMKDTDIHQTLFSNKTTGFDSMLATPTKANVKDILTESSTSIVSQKMNKTSNLCGLQRK